MNDDSPTNEIVERIDVMHLGVPGAICCHRFGDVLIDPGPATSIDHVIEALGDREPRVVLLTHIHLDHAGGTGALVERFPDLEVYVHEIGAPYMIDPERLVASATRVFGDQMDRLWGPVTPIPDANIHTVADDEVVFGLRAILTPGHSGHHLAFLHEDGGIAVIGDLFGQAVEGEEAVMLPTPPPEIDLELWADSIRKLLSFDPVEVGLTHFGRVEQVEHQADLALEEIARVGELSRAGDADALIAYLESDLAKMSPEVARGLSQSAPPLEQLWLGLERYWRKRRERDAAGESAAT